MKTPTNPLIRCEDPEVNLGEIYVPLSAVGLIQITKDGNYLVGLIDSSRAVLKADAAMMKALIEESNAFRDANDPVG